ncbi:MAG TPA: alpha-hydroxy-acid oxidizing protein [Gemmatimonadales bacterium]|nr:alpha-hydroxy-acid oxidizing protein [Gemmatimonadales bacterium]
MAHRRADLAHGERRGGGRRAVRVLQPGLGVDGGVRRRHGRHPALAPAVLEPDRRRGGEFRAAGRGVRLRGDRAHARYHDARLAPPRPRARLAPVPPRDGDRPVHQRSRLPRRAAPAGRRTAGARRPAHTGGARLAPGVRGAAPSAPGEPARQPALRRAAMQRFIATYSRPSLTWPDLAALRRLTRLPLLRKGVLRPDDARRAVELGADGIIVSNHGGRQVDGAIAALDALPPVVDAVGGRVPVLMDGGIRRGADILKALALGARAVLLGRPYAYGLAIAGEAGVREVLRDVIADLDLTLGLAGYRSVAELGPEALARGDAGSPA